MAYSLKHIQYLLKEALSDIDNINGEGFNTSSASVDVDDIKSQLKALESKVQEIKQEIPSTSDFVTNTALDKKLQGIHTSDVDTSDFVTKESLATKLDLSSVKKLVNAKGYYVENSDILPVLSLLVNNLLQPHEISFKANKGISEISIVSEPNVGYTYGVDEAHQSELQKTNSEGLSSIPFGDEDTIVIKCYGYSDSVIKTLMVTLEESLLRAMASKAKFVTTLNGLSEEDKSVIGLKLTKPLDGNGASVFSACGCDFNFGNLPDNVSIVIDNTEDSPIALNALRQPLGYKSGQHVDFYINSVYGFDATDNNKSPRELLSRLKENPLKNISARIFCPEINTDNVSMYFPATAQILPVAKQTFTINGQSYQGYCTPVFTLDGSKQLYIVNTYGQYYTPVYGERESF